eukprot:CAMPEP_0194408840 /NCGR_PEP_ID=MMETSP0176-20130528/6586_1 /TAXON_ID=216777 /ORGANISM="Proboscia alata, Strain PI-D3" /LENGTH=48 /DNA_ID= /DNA_START= /DNA_END= /DNA_ORIENTATION=
MSFFCGEDTDPTISPSPAAAASSASFLAFAAASAFFLLAANIVDLDCT